MKLISKQKMLGASLVGRYSFKEVEDVIEEGCIHQLQDDTEWLLKRTKRERYIKELEIWKLEVWVKPEEYKKLKGGE